MCATCKFTCKFTNSHPKHINDVLDAYLKFNVHGQKENIISISY